MDPQIYSPERFRTALFVDFDNIFITLRDQDEQFSKAFGENQEGWLNWLEKRLGNPQRGYQLTNGSKDERPDSTGRLDLFSRNILVRRCYLNPKSFADYRPYFIRSGFEVIDCPQLTAQGKTSTDIHLVIDVLDTLYRSAHFDEFIILSGDADFTPLLLRLRIHDRRTAILSAGYASPAYKASSDYIIPTDIFIREALGIDIQEDEAVEQIQPDEINVENEALLQKMADQVFEAAEDPSGIQANDLPAVYASFPEFKQSSHWLGFQTLRRLTEQIVSLHDELTIIEEDPWCVARIEEVKDGAPETKAAETCKISGDIRRAITDCIKNIVEESHGAVTLADLSRAIKKKFPSQLANNDWFGAGGFKKFLHSLDLGDFKLSPRGPGYLYDPIHRKPPVSPYSTVAPGKKLRQDLFFEKYPKIASLAWKIHQFTDVPYLMQEHYNLLFVEIAREVNERGYQLTRTSKTVRDRCVEKGAPVSRAIVNYILINLRNSGQWPFRTPVDSAKLAELTCKQVLNLCRIAQLEVKPEESIKIAKWITGKEALPV